MVILSSTSKRLSAVVSRKPRKKLNHMSRNTTSVRTERSFNSFEGGQEKYFVDTMGCIAHHDVFYFIFFRPVDQSIPLYLIIFGI